MSASDLTRVPCRVDTREEVLKPLKRGGQSYDDLFRAMAEQYDPDTVVEILQDNLDEKTGRELDSYSYRIEVDNREVSTWFRHGDLTPNQE